MGRLLAVVAFGAVTALGAWAAASADEASPERDVIESPEASPDENHWD
jgi:hypothetical protein